jgi:phospholipase C
MPGVPLKFWACSLVAAFALSACKGGGYASPALPLANPQSRQVLSQLAGPLAGRGKIQHVVIIVQENRSFNNLFYGYPGAKTVTFGYDSKNQKVPIMPVGLETTWTINHDATAFFEACNGTGKIPGTSCRMNGFDREIVTCGHSGQPPCPTKHPQYIYVPQSETTPYFDMAKQYVLGDEMFASNFDVSSFISHQYIIAGQAESAINYPTGDWGCPGGPADKVPTVSQARKYPHGYKTPCWDPTTLGDELDTAGLTWAFYASPIGKSGGIWSAYQAIKHIYEGPDWSKDVITPQTQFFNDVSSGNMRSVSWITPNYPNSDHPGAGSKTGPSWVASIVNAVGQSKYWNSSAIFIFWDEYGGLYDSQAPAYVDYDGLGMRIPLLIVSPYAKKGYVSHVHYEHGSILRFVEDQFNLPRLAASDNRANSTRVDCFDFSQPPRKFVKIAAPYDQKYFMLQPLDSRPPDPQ